MTGRRLHRCVNREIGFAQEAFGRIDELLEVFDPFAPVLLLPIMRDQS